MKRILVIEDDINILDIVSFNLSKEGYTVVTATDGEEGLLTFAAHKFDLVILDVMMPKVNGLQVLDSIRSRSDIPVLIMSARTSEEDRLDGLARMADDYICKPFSVKELMARVKVHLSRYDRQTGGGKGLQWGDYTIEPDGVLHRGEQIIPLSPKEAQLVTLFAQNPGRLYTREAIFCGIWGYPKLMPEDRSVDVAIRRLREKIEDDPSNPRYILSKRGQGYIAGNGK